MAKPGDAALFVASGGQRWRLVLLGGAAVRRPRTDWAVRGKPGALVLRAQDRPADRPAPTTRPSACPGIDCVRHFLPRRVIAAAEHRARSIGVGGDRVLICGDAITEEAYLTALAAFLGTSYGRLDRIPRGDCSRRCICRCR
jgi:hypothetical protein